MRVLVVKSQFKNYVRGSRITDQAEIDAILKSEWRVNVVQANHQDDLPPPALRNENPPDEPDAQE